MSKVSINEITLTNIGDAIREKTGKTDLIAPGDMPAEIKAIVTGGGDGPTAEELTLTGDMSYAFYKGRFDWVINRHGHLMTTKDIKNPEYMFDNTTVEEIPFSLNFDPNHSYNSDAHCRNLFNGAHNLKSLPAMNNFKPYSLANFVCSCDNLREIPEDAFDSWDWSFIDGATYASSASMANMFQSCRSLRKIPMAPLYHGNPTWKSPTYHTYNYMCSGCHSLDEITNIPAPKNAAISITSNVFSSMVYNCNRLKEFTFAPGITLNWSNQTIDLSGYCGYAFSAYDILHYNSGITMSKQVSDDASYQALKNDPDWYTTDEAYSRYNHTSAVNTINSLPTVKSGTIKFKGIAGSKTDGGAINTLTEEEIAVAVAKNWTVTFV